MGSTATVRRQRAIPGKRRKRIGAYVIKQVRNAARMEAAAKHASVSFVIMQRLADSYGIALPNEDRLDRMVRQARSIVAALRVLDGGKRKRA